MTDNDKMREDAIREAARNAALDEYFKARPQLMWSRHEECLFEAGFDSAWQAAQAEQSAELERLRKDAERYRWLRIGKNDMKAMDLIEDHCDSDLDQAIDAAIAAEGEK